MPKSQIMTSTGLISAPLTEVVKYDSTWSYCVSHSSQTSRFSAPYPELTIQGKPLLPIKQATLHSEEQLPKIDSELMQLEEAKQKREAREKREAEECTDGRRHLRRKFGNRTIIDNGALTLEEVYDFFHANADSEASDSPRDSEIPTQFKLSHGDTEEENLATDLRDMGSLIKRSDVKTSVAFRSDSMRMMDSLRSSANFLRQRTIQDAEEGANLRFMSSRGGGMSSTNRASNAKVVYHTLEHASRAQSQASPCGHEQGYLQKNEEFYRLSEEIKSKSRGASKPPRGSILRKDSKCSKKAKADRGGSVAFKSSQELSSVVELPIITQPYLGTPNMSFEALRKSHNYQEGCALSNDCSAMSLDHALIDRHEGHTKEFEHLRISRIKADEKEEGKTFRLSFDPTSKRDDNTNFNYTTVNADGQTTHSTSSGKDHVSFEPNVDKGVRRPSFEELRRSSILPEERKEGAALRRTNRLYHGTDGGVYGLFTNFPEQSGRNDLRKFKMSSKLDPEDQIMLLTHDDGQVFGYYESAPLRSCLQKREESSSAFQLIYNTRNLVVGFKTDQIKEDHSADFERMRQLMIIEAEKEEGKAFKAYWQMARNEEINLEEDFPLTHFQDHHDTSGRQESSQQRNETAVHNCKSTEKKELVSSE